MNLSPLTVVTGELFLLRVKSEIIFPLGNASGEIASTSGVCPLTRWVRCASESSGCFISGMNVIPKFKVHTWEFRMSLNDILLVFWQRNCKPKRPCYSKCKHVWQGQTYTSSTFITVESLWTHFLNLCFSGISLHLMKRENQKETEMV